MEPIKTDFRKPRNNACRSLSFVIPLFHFQRARPISHQKKPSITSFAQNIRRKMRPAPKKKVNLQYDTEGFLQR